MKYSIVIPVYNGENCIGKCLDSIISQIDKKNGEIIVVNDGSTDSTKEVVSRYKDSVNLIDQKNSGPAIARNTGVSNAFGNIILFIDADCVADKEWLINMILPFSDSSIIAVKGAYKTLQKGIAPRLAQVEFEHRYKLLRSHKNIDFVDSYCMGVKKEAFFEVGGFDCSFTKADNEDVDLSYKLSKLPGKMIFIPDAIVFHQHRNCIIQYAKTKFGRGYYRFKVYKNHPDKVFKDSYTPQTLKIQVLLCGVLVFILFPINFLFKKTFSKLINYIIVMFFLSGFDFLKVLLKKDPFLIVWFPLFLFIRALSLFTGSVYGFFDFFILKK